MVYIFFLSAYIITNFLVWFNPITPPPPKPLITISQIDHSSYPKISLYVQIIDNTNSRLEGLNPSNFEVSEDNILVPLTDFISKNQQSIHTVLVIDKSGSMGKEGKLEGAQKAASTFASLMRSQDQVALIIFDSKVSLWQDFTNNPIELTQKLSSITPGDCTAWYDAIVQSLELIKPYTGRKSIILLSDGLDCREDMERKRQTYGSKFEFTEVLYQLHKAEIPLYAIAFGDQPTTILTDAENYDEERLKQVARQSGGLYFHAPTQEDLITIYRALAVQIQQEYVLSYLSPRPYYDGTHRDIKVQLTENESLTNVDTKAYLEGHLLNIQSHSLVAVILGMPLLMATLIPLGWKAFVSRKDHSTLSKKLIICIYCGYPIQDSANFCPHCGRKKFERKNFTKEKYN